MAFAQERWFEGERRGGELCEEAAWPSRGEHKTPAFGPELGPSLPLSSHTSFVSRSIQKVGGPEGPPQRVEIHFGGTDIWGRGRLGGLYITLLCTFEDFYN